MKHDDGGPAYPVSFPSDWHEKHGGMSLLDAFAMKVLPAVYAEKMSEMKKNDFAPADWRNVVIADECYTMAAAMVAEKRRREGGGA